MHHYLTTACATATLLVATALTAPIASSDTTRVLSTTLDDMQGMEANIVRFSVDADWVTDRHIHPGHVFVYVTAGSIEINVEGQEPRTVSAGEAFHELPNQAMVARTLSSDGAEFIVFQVGPEGEPLMVSQPE